MQSTVDWVDEMFTTKFPTGSNSSEDVITPVLRGKPVIPRIAGIEGIIAIGAAGILTNLVVLFGFCLAGRSFSSASQEIG